MLESPGREKKRYHYSGICILFQISSLFVAVVLFLLDTAAIVSFCLGSVAGRSIRPYALKGESVQLYNNFRWTDAFFSGNASIQSLLKQLHFFWKYLKMLSAAFHPTTYIPLPPTTLVWVVPHESAPNLVSPVLWTSSVNLPLKCIKLVLKTKINANVLQKLLQE